MSHAEDTHDNLDAWWQRKYDKDIAARDAEIERLRKEQVNNYAVHCSACMVVEARVAKLKAALRTAHGAIASLDEDAWKCFDVAEVLTICDNALENKP